MTIPIVRNSINQKNWQPYIYELFTDAKKYKDNKKEVFVKGALYSHQIDYIQTGIPGVQVNVLETQRIRPGLAYYKIELL